MSFLRTTFRKFCTGNGKYVVEQLNQRDIIRVCGTDVIPFLQGLITNDMNHLIKGSKSMYAMFLNKNGRVLFDSIVYKTIQPDTFLIECDKDISGDLRRHLRLFRVRRKIDVDSVGDDYSPWVLYDPERTIGPIKLPPQTNEILSSGDPRLKALGYRLILPKSLEFLEIENLFSSTLNLTCSTDGENDYKIHRYKLGIGEGVIDHPPTKCFPLEANCDFLHGVSFHKGCYIGQELTARSFHTGTIRKRLMPVQISQNLTDAAEHVQLVNGTNVGNIRGIKGKTALALIRLEQALKASELQINHIKVEVKKPNWWPIEMSQKVPIANVNKN